MFCLMENNGPVRRARPGLRFISTGNREHGQAQHLRGVSKKIVREREREIKGEGWKTLATAARIVATLARVHLASESWIVLLLPLPIPTHLSTDIIHPTQPRCFYTTHTHRESDSISLACLFSSPLLWCYLSMCGWLPLGWRHSPKKHRRRNKGMRIMERAGRCSCPLISLLMIHIL